MDNLKNVLDNLHLNNSVYKVRLFNDADGRLLKNSDKILASNKLDKFEVTSIGMNEVYLTYDIRIKVVKE